jgi:hypothetical protein
MSDPTPTPTPSLAPQTSRRAQWAISKEVTTELDLADHICATAQRTVYATALAGEDIDNAAIRKLSDAITAADDLVFKATGGKAGKKILTKTGQDLEDALVAKIQAIQKRAKRKYTSATDPNREKYFIGAGIESNHGLLVTAADAIIKTLGTDTLPGVKPATIADLQKALDDFKAGLGTQSGGKGDTGAAFQALKAKIKEIATLRRDIQYAADTVWPYGDPANAPIRAEFRLPADRSLK